VKLTQPDVGLDYPLSDKQKKHLAEKREIGKAGASLIKEGNTIILDSGSTTFELAKNLGRFERVTVITNAINIARYLSEHKNINVIVPGGILRRNSMSLVGMLAEKGLKDYFCDILFIGVDGFDINYGISTPNNEEAQLNQTMIDISRRVVVIADSSKFQRRAFAFIAGIEKIHTVITDDGISALNRSKLQSAGIEVIVV